MQAPEVLPVVVSPNPTIAVLADAYLEFVKRERAEDTFEWYRYRLQQFCAKYPDLTVKNLKPLHVQQWPGN